MRDSLVPRYLGSRMEVEGGRGKLTRDCDASGVAQKVCLFLLQSFLSSPLLSSSLSSSLELLTLKKREWDVSDASRCFAHPEPSFMAFPSIRIRSVRRKCHIHRQFYCAEGSWGKLCYVAWSF